MKTQTIAIIGLERAGASVALAIRDSPLEVTLIGHDRDRQVMKEAKERQIIDKSYNSIANLADDADILVIAEPYAQVRETLEAIAPYVKPHAVVLEFGPLKRPTQTWVDDHLPQGHYVAMRPVWQAEALSDARLGIDAADPHLFRNSIVCLMPASQVSSEAVETAASFGRLLGCTPFYVDPAEYDTYVQALETLPALLGAAYFRTLTRSQGWRDMLRFAGLPFAQATGPLAQEADAAHIAFSDAPAALSWLDRLLEDLVELRRWLAEGDQESLGALLTELNIQRDEWLHTRRQNDWSEGKSPQVETQTLSQQLFGSFGFRRPSNDK